MAGYNDGVELFAAQGSQVVGGAFYVFYPHFWVIQKYIFGTAINISAVDGINAADVPFIIIQGKNDDMIPYDSTSIYAHRNWITNSKVQYILTDYGHEYPYSSEAAAEYRGQMKKSYDEYRERPEIKAAFENDEQNIIKLKKEWAESVNFDKILYNEVDESIFNDIYKMFDGAK